MMERAVWGSLRRQHWREHVSLPPDLQAVKLRLALIMDNMPQQNATATPHAPHQQAREECDQTECLGYGNVEPTVLNNYGRRIFGQ
jgi:hypothetical protein